MKYSPAAAAAAITTAAIATMSHVELVPGARVVQAWRVKLWPEGQYSLVRFTLAPDGAGTKLVLDHSGYPEGEHEHLSAGWRANYLEPLAKLG